MRSILIDPTTKVVSEVSTGGSLSEIYALLKVQQIQGVTVAEHEVCFVDEDGLLVHKPGPFFNIGDHPHPIAGRGLIFGVNQRTADHTSTQMTLERVRGMVDFPDVELAGFRSFKGTTELFGNPAVIIGQEPVFVPADTPIFSDESHRPQILFRKSLADSQLATLDAVHEYSVKSAVKKFEKRGTIPPLWVVRTRYGVTVLSTKWRDDREKAGFVGWLRFFLKAMEATHYSLMQEAWMASVAPDSREADIKPQHNPDSEDVLMVITFNREAKHRVTRFGVKYSDKRPGFGRLLARDDWDSSDLSWKGRMMNLLEPDAEVEAAVEKFKDDLGRRLDEVIRGGGTVEDLIRSAGSK